MMVLITKGVVMQDGGGGGGGKGDQVPHYVAVQVHGGPHLDQSQLSIESADQSEASIR